MVGCPLHLIYSIDAPQLALQRRVVVTWYTLQVTVNDQGVLYYGLLYLEQVDDSVVVSYLFAGQNVFTCSSAGDYIEMCTGRTTVVMSCHYEWRVLIGLESEACR